jgi:hypothetical protein
MSETQPGGRYLLGGGAAACAVCCAAPLVGLLGLAGAAATAFTLAFAGVAFAVVVGLTTLVVTLTRRRSERAGSCPTTEAGPVDVTIGRLK